MSTAVLDRNSQATNTILPLPSTGNPDRSGTSRDVYMNAAPRANLARRAFFLVHGTDVQVSTAFTSYITTTVQESRGWWLGMDKLLLEARDALNSRLPVFGAQFALSHFS